MSHPVKHRPGIRPPVADRARYATQLAGRICELCREPLGWGRPYLEDETKPGSPASHPVCHLQCAREVYEYRNKVRA